MVRVVRAPGLQIQGVGSKALDAGKWAPQGREFPNLKGYQQKIEKQLNITTFVLEVSLRRVLNLFGVCGQNGLTTSNM